MFERFRKCAVLLVAAAVLLAGVPAFADGDGYSTYVNSDVCFTVDYPEGYSVSAPYVNSVFISDGDDFHFSAEYVFQSLAGDRCFYSAADFAAWLDADEQALASWVGVSECELTDVSSGELAGRQCTVYSYETPDGYTGSLALFDGEGDLGCYCVGAHIRLSSQKFPTYADQAGRMIDSFRITGACTPEGYTCYRFDGEDGPVQFVLQDEHTHEVQQRDSGNISIYPLEHVFSEGNIVINKSPYDQSDAVEDVLESLCHYWFNYKDDTSYTTGVTQFDAGGNTYYTVQVAYSDDGSAERTDEVIFLQDGEYWEIYSTCTEEYAETVGAAMNDLMCSIRVGGAVPGGGSAGTGTAAESEPSGGQGLSGEGNTSAPAARTWSVDEQIDTIVAQTRAVSGFIVSDYMEPLGSATDVDNDGIWEFLEVYETKNDTTGATTVRYAAWALQEGGPVLLASDALFMEVGGNSGYIGIAKRDAAYYLVVASDSPDGDSFHKTWHYIPWQGASLGSDETVFTTDGSYFEGGGTCTVDGEAVSSSDFVTAQGAFTELFHLDIVEGHGNGNVMTLDVVDDWVFDL